MSVRKRESKKAKNGYVWEVYFKYKENAKVMRFSKYGFSTKKDAEEYEIKVKSDKYIRLDFNQVKSYDFKEKVHISNREDALNLLMMTPHYYHIKKEKRGVLDTLQGLDITIDIKVTVYALS